MWEINDNEHVDVESMNPDDHDYSGFSLNDLQTETKYEGSKTPAQSLMRTKMKINELVAREQKEQGDDYDAAKVSDKHAQLLKLKSEFENDIAEDNVSIQATCINVTKSQVFIVANEPATVSRPSPRPAPPTPTAPSTPAPRLPTSTLERVSRLRSQVKCVNACRRIGVYCYGAIWDS